jgi:hypothetical protein
MPRALFSGVNAQWGDEVAVACCWWMMGEIAGPARQATGRDRHLVGREHVGVLVHDGVDFGEGQRVRLFEQLYGLLRAEPKLRHRIARPEAPVHFEDFLVIRPRIPALTVHMAHVHRQVEGRAAPAVHLAKQLFRARHRPGAPVGVYICSTRPVRPGFSSLPYAAAPPIFLQRILKFWYLRGVLHTVVGEEAWQKKPSPSPTAPACPAMFDHLLRNLSPTIGWVVGRPSVA